MTGNWHDAARTLAWPGATGLYLPQTWPEDAVRRKAAPIPAELPCQTKAELALALLAEAHQGGVRHACVVADAA